VIGNNSKQTTYKHQIRDWHFDTFVVL